MNKVIMMGRLCAEPEVRYGGANNTAVANFRIAVDRRFKRDGEPDADFFLITALGKQGEFAEKYLKKGTKILVQGRIQTGSYTNKDGQTVYTTDVIVDEHEFVESKNASSQGADFGGGNAGFSGQTSQPADVADGFMPIPDGIDEELPFA